MNVPIAYNSIESTSNIPENIRENYNILNKKRKSLEIPRAIQVPYETKVHGCTLQDNYAWMQNEAKYRDVIDIYLDEENDYAEEYLGSQMDDINYLTTEMKNRIDLEQTQKIANVQGFDYYITYIEEKGLPIY